MEQARRQQARQKMEEENQVHEKATAEEERLAKADKEAQEKRAAEAGRKLLQQAKNRAERINCISNLKQIGISFKLWSGDNNDRFPFNTPIKDGGTMELCRLGDNGFDANSFLHFQVMSNELNVPKILVCPTDSGRSLATSF